jgi:hypothetical protein
MEGRKCRRTKSRVTMALLLFLAAVHAGCADSPTVPSARALVTLQVGPEQFRVQLNSKDQVEAARRAQQGGAARIPNGRIIVGTSENAGWSWHLEEVTFVEVAIELCDGRPSDVERGGTQFGGGRFCPWNAGVVSILDN